MPRDSSGTYSRVLSYQADANGPAFQALSPARFDQEMADVAAEISNSTTRGEFLQLQTSINGLIPWSAVSAFARTLFDDADQGAVRQTIGLGTAATAAASSFVLKAGDTGIGALAGTIYSVSDYFEIVGGGDHMRLDFDGTTFMVVNGAVPILSLSKDGATFTVRANGATETIYHSGNLSPVKTVNNVAPDAAGNVTIAAGGGSTASLPAPGTYGDIQVTATEMQVRAEAVTNSKLAKAPAMTVKGNLTGAAAIPQDYPVGDLMAGILADPLALDTIRVAATRPLVCYRKTIATVDQIRAVPTYAHGAVASLELWVSINNGAFFLAAFGPNNAEVSYALGTAVNTYRAYSRVTYNAVEGPHSEVINASTGGGDSGFDLGGWGGGAP